MTKANAEIVYKRNSALWKEKLISDNDLDGFRLALQTAEANLDKARADLQTAKTNLGYCTIKAPVDGVVVARLVDVGQTVAASFSTPSLFTIAQDLSRMKVAAAIDEADIGQVKVGQRAFFTVESYPDKQFKGVVSEVQLNPVVTNNVVTYTVVLEVDNEPRTAYIPAQDPEPGQGAGHDRKAGALSIGQAGTLEHTTARYMPPGSPVYNGNMALFPGMTADCSIVTNRRDNVVRVPSAALRFNPAAFVPVAELKAAEAPRGKQPRPAAAPASGAPSAGGSRGVAARSEDHLWVLENGQLKTVPVKVGVSDGMYTEVSGEGIAPGLEVVTGVGEMKKNPSSGPLAGPGLHH